MPMELIMVQESKNQKQISTDDKIKKMQIEIMDSEKCKEFAQKLVAYISGDIDK